MDLAIDNVIERPSKWRRIAMIPRGNSRNPRTERGRVCVKKAGRKPGSGLAACSTDRADTRAGREAASVGSESDTRKEQSR